MRARITAIGLLVLAGFAAACSGSPSAASDPALPKSEAQMDSTSSSNPGPLEKGGHWAGTGH